MEQSDGHQLDTIVVANIDLDCEIIDPEMGYNHKDYFEVRYEKNPYRIKPGETRRLPRFVANHYAKHLTDHILSIKGIKEKNDFVIRDDRERDRVMGEILLRVEDHFMEDLRSDADKASQTVNKLNPGLPSGDDLNSMPLELRYKRNELFKIAKGKGLKLTGGETKKELAAIIQEV
ncbi:MAG: hypothetical protein QME66_04180 [Candidatus Eisenbacteria bacterium]|nr:hypothetical protein [Candidatus Eisenbacteria bacterium]